MDYGQFSDDLAADTDPTNRDRNPDDDPGNSGRAEDQAPLLAIKLCYLATAAT
jgi:hypothetical protein